MMIAAMIGYYVLAIGLVALVGYLAGRKNNQEIRAFADQAITELQQIASLGATATSQVPKIQ